MGIPRFLLASVAVLFFASVTLSAPAQSLPRPSASSRFSPPVPAISSIAPLHAPTGAAAMGNAPNPGGAELTTPGFSLWIEKGPYLAGRASCYALRVYRFAETRRGSGVMKPNGSSTCEAASLFHLKDLTGSVKAK